MSKKFTVQGQNGVYEFDDGHITLKKRNRGFEAVNGAPEDTVEPTRATEDSAGYDFVLPYEVTIKPGQLVQVWTNIKAYMRPGEFLMLVPRSSIGTKYHVKLVNTVGIIDQGYYSNPDNDGNIGAGLWNFGNNTVTIPGGKAFCQGVFLPFFTTDTDDVKTKRVGGYGSTDK